MTKERLSMYLLILLVVNLLLTSVFTFINIYCDIDKVVVPDNFTSIQQALEIVFNDGEVIVKKGAFTEYIYVKKPVKLYGLENVKLYGSIKVLGTINVSISGFTIIVIPPGTEVGVVILNSSKVIIEDVIFIGTGIIIYNSEHVIIRRCRFVDVVGPAIRILGSSKNIIIEWNNISDTYIGLFVEEGENILFRYNNVSSKDLAILLHRRAKNVTIYMNNFIKTMVEDYGTNNTWYEPNLKLGNFWGGLEGAYINSDKILDIPMYADNKILDPYPLATYFHEYLNISNIRGCNLDSSPIRCPYDFFPHLLLVVTIITVAIIIIIFIRKRSSI